VTTRERTRVRALRGSMVGWLTEAYLPVSSTGVETDRAAAEVTTRTMTEGMKRRRFRCDRGMVAAAARR
jgi:hypothetical protein